MKNKAVVIGACATSLGIVRSLCREGVEVILLYNKGDRSKPAAYSRLCKKIFCAGGEEGYLNQLVEIGKSFEEKLVLFISSDKDVLFVSKNREVLSKYYLINLPNKDTVNMLMDKCSFAEYAIKKSLLIPKSFIVNNILELAAVADKIKYPCIIKFYLGAVYKSDTKEDLLNLYKMHSKCGNKVLIQEWVPGLDSDVYFCFLYFDENSRPLASFTARKLRQWPPENGSTSLAVSETNEYIKNKSIELFRAVGYKGLGSVEFKRDIGDGSYKITEPTVGRSNLQVILAAACNVNLTYLAYCDLTKISLPDINKQENGKKWIHESFDVYSSIYYAKNRKLSFRGWHNSVKSRKVFVFFTLNDPLPFVMELCKIIGSLFGALARKITKLKSSFKVDK